MFFTNWWNKKQKTITKPKEEQVPQIHLHVYVNDGSIDIGVSSLPMAGTAIATFHDASIAVQPSSAIILTDDKAQRTAISSLVDLSKQIHKESDTVVMKQMYHKISSRKLISAYAKHRSFQKVAAQLGYSAPFMMIYLETRPEIKQQLQACLSSIQMRSRSIMHLPIDSKLKLLVNAVIQLQTDHPHQSISVQMLSKALSVSKNYMSPLIYFLPHDVDTIVNSLAFIGE